MGDIQLPLRPPSSYMMEEEDTVFKLSVGLKESSMDEQHREADGNHHEGSSSSSSPKRLRHRLTSALFRALGIKRSTGGTVSSGNEKSKKIEVSEHGCYISDRRESPRSASNSSSCFSLWDDEGARSLSMERQIEMLDGNDELNEPNSSTRLSNSSADSEVIGLHAPLYTFLKGIGIEEEEEDPAGSESKEPNGETVVVGRMTKREINIKDLKFPQLSSLLSPAILSFHKIRMARRFFSNLGSNHKAGVMNLNVKKMLLDAFGGRKRLMANVSGGEQLWDKRILMGNKCRPLDFSSSPSHDDECSIQVMEELAIEGMSVSSSSSHLKE